MASRRKCFFFFAGRPFFPPADVWAHPSFRRCESGKPTKCAETKMLNTYCFAPAISTKKTCGKMKIAGDGHGHQKTRPQRGPSKPGNAAPRRAATAQKDTENGAVPEPKTDRLKRVRKTLAKLWQGHGPQPQDQRTSLGSTKKRGPRANRSKPRNAAAEACLQEKTLGDKTLLGGRLKLDFIPLVLVRRVRFEVETGLLGT